jgi:hypothetical protein
MTATSPYPRRHHTDLQPLVTRPDTPVHPTRRNSTQGQGQLPRKSVTTLPSPRIIAARAFYIELESPIGPEGNAIKRRRSLIQGRQLPRRRSIMTSTGNLVYQLDSFEFAPTREDHQAVSGEEETGKNIKTEDDELCMNGISEITPIEKIRKSSLICGTPHEVLRQVPFQYIHDHLRDWGYAYLGDSETADAFVNAVSLRRPSLELTDELQVRSTDSVMIRARVLPKAKERKPFLIQRKFNIDELRSRIPKRHVTRDIDLGPIPLRPRRSCRIRRSSAWQARAHEKDTSGGCRTPIAERHTPLGTGTVPIRKSL